jgi:hypothetical protein
MTLRSSGQRQYLFGAAQVVRVPNDAEFDDNSDLRLPGPRRNVELLGLSATVETRVRLVSELRRDVRGRGLARERIGLECPRANGRQSAADEHAGSKIEASI